MHELPSHGLATTSLIKPTSVVPQLLGVPSLPADDAQNSARNADQLTTERSDCGDDQLLHGADQSMDFIQKVRPYETQISQVYLKGGVSIDVLSPETGKSSFKPEIGKSDAMKCEADDLLPPFKGVSEQSDRISKQLSQSAASQGYLKTTPQTIIQWHPPLQRTSDIVSQIMQQSARQSIQLMPHKSEKPIMGKEEKLCKPAEAEEQRLPDPEGCTPLRRLSSTLKPIQAHASSSHSEQDQGDGPEERIVDTANAHDMHIDFAPLRNNDGNQSCESPKIICDEGISVPCQEENREAETPREASSQMNEALSENGSCRIESSSACSEGPPQTEEQRLSEHQGVTSKESVSPDVQGESAITTARLAEDQAKTNLDKVTQIKSKQVSKNLQKRKIREQLDCLAVQSYFGNEKEQKHGKSSCQSRSSKATIPSQNVSVVKRQTSKQLDQSTRAEVPKSSNLSEAQPVDTEMADMADEAQSQSECMANGHELMVQQETNDHHQRDLSPIDIPQRLQSPMRTVDLATIARALGPDPDLVTPKQTQAQAQIAGVGPVAHQLQLQQNLNVTMAEDGHQNKSEHLQSVKPIQDVAAANHGPESIEFTPGLPLVALNEVQDPAGAAESSIAKLDDLMPVFQLQKAHPSVSSPKDSQQQNQIMLAAVSPRTDTQKSTNKQISTKEANIESMKGLVSASFAMETVSPSKGATTKGRKNNNRGTTTSSFGGSELATDGPAMSVKTDKNGARTGRWTREEHFRFLEALKKYGKEWKKVQQHVGTRSSTQARSHAQKFFVKLEKKNLSMEEFLQKLDLLQLQRSMIGNDSEYDDEEVPMFAMKSDTQSIKTKNAALVPAALSSSEQAKQDVECQSTGSQQQVKPQGFGVLAATVQPSAQTPRPPSQSHVGMTGKIGERPGLTKGNKVVPMTPPIRPLQRFKSEHPLAGQQTFQMGRPMNESDIDGPFQQQVGVKRKASQAGMLMDESLPMPMTSKRAYKGSGQKVYAIGHLNSGILEGGQEALIEGSDPSNLKRVKSLAFDRLQGLEAHQRFNLDHQKSFNARLPDHQLNGRTALPEIGLAPLGQKAFSTLPQYPKQSPNMPMVSVPKLTPSTFDSHLEDERLAQQISLQRGSGLFYQRPPLQQTTVQGDLCFETGHDLVTRSVGEMPRSRDLAVSQTPRLQPSSRRQMLVPQELGTVERARSLLDYEIPQMPKPQQVKNNSMLMELDDFGHEFDISSSNNDFNYLKVNEPARRPEQDVADRLRSIENFNNGEHHQQFNQQPVNLMGDFTGIAGLDFGEIAMRNRSLTFNIPQAIQNEMMMGLGQSALEMHQKMLKPRPRRNPRLSFDFDDTTNRHNVDDHHDD